MHVSGNMDNHPYRNLPPLWYIRRREHIETHFQALATLRDDLDLLVGGEAIAPILDAVDALRDLYAQVDSMQVTLDRCISTTVIGYNPHNRNELGRIKELVLATASHLESMAQQISWGYDEHGRALAVKRNLNPLIDLTGKVLIWLEQAI
jgi:hypothetical protein